MKTRTHILTTIAPQVIVIVLILFVGLVSCSDDETSAVESPNKITYTGDFVRSSNDVTTSASGTVTGTFDPTTLKMNYTITWSNLTAESAAMHFHDNGPVIIEISGFPASTSGSVSGTASFSADEANDLATGEVYVQIHTSSYPSGEVLATLTKKSSSNPSSSPGGGSGY